MVSSTQVSQSDSKLLPKASLIPHLSAPRRKLVPFFIGLTFSYFELLDTECKGKTLKQEERKEGQQRRRRRAVYKAMKSYTYV